MRLAGLIVKNYKIIGDTPYEIKIDEIVVLIGQNNAGKSTMLDAYESFASSGKELSKTYFHNEDVSKPIEITGIFDSITAEDEDTIGKKWKYNDSDYGECIKLRWIWTSPEKKATKQSFNPETDSFEDGGMGGWDTLIQSRIPQPIRIKPTESVETTQTKIVTLLKTIVKDRLKADSSKTKAAIDEIEKLAQTIFSESKTAFDDIANKITKNVSTIFPGTKIELIPQSKDAIDEKIVGAESFLKVGTEGTYNSPLMQQGTGIQRALLWSALSVMSDVGDGKKKTKQTGEATKILLIDEPEAFLHPPTIRETRESLYDFALQNPDWQVLATTHSPVFIDLSKDHTTIIRVDANSSTQRYVSTDKISFEVDERTRLQMIRASNPMVNEFFFYENIILVEGPTEQIAIQHIAKEIGLNIHVINCLGKANITLFSRILNQFKVPYIVIHDSDTPKIKRKGKHIQAAMWTINERIRQSIDFSLDSNLYVQVPNFEGEFLNEELSNGKVDRVIELLSDKTSAEYKLLLDQYTKILKREPLVFQNSETKFNEKIANYKIKNKLETNPLWN
ncbi:ATP-dependent endonuclease [Leptospira congkakensis]|uniref:ATP-dependent endonuclease n=1 Tax=Leptospira congkakensis TaxID=2484932 RepID=A0A4Z1AFF6_9LEPT|nr:AAA family ATPase [Leptospira congkakensis]TGL90067.1 ATP-dependent endonuclease [Leptospira congkakensis]TGL97381.1 ATP-dependent endonuclease [Leptospira congkakensis]TGL97891.1 ATP-dependent endonuclease [Leptospira congkakensis]